MTTPIRSALAVGLRAARPRGYLGWVQLVSIVLLCALITGSALAGASVMIILARQDATTSARTIQVDSARPSGLRAAEIDTMAGGLTIERVVISGQGSRMTHPPGIAAIPGAREVYVSPALDRLLGRHAELQGLVDKQRRVGLIGRAGLRDPGELLMYQGVVALEGAAGALRPINGFGVERAAAWHLSGRAAVTAPLLLLVVGGPLLIALVVAIRMTKTEDDRRGAILRSLGVTTGLRRVVALGQVLLPSVCGALVGLVWFLLVWCRGHRVPLVNLRYFPQDSVLPPLLTVALVGASLLLCILVAVGGRDRVAVTTTRAHAGGRSPRPRDTALFLAGLGLVAVLSAPGDSAGVWNEVGIVVSCFLFLIGVTRAVAFVVSRWAQRVRMVSDRGGCLIGSRWAPQDQAGAFRLAIGMSAALMVLGFVLPFATSLRGGSVIAENRLASARGFNLTVDGSHLDAPTLARLNGARAVLPVREVTDGAGRSLSVVIADCAQLQKFVRTDGCVGAQQWLTDVRGPVPTAARVGVDFPLQTPGAIASRGITEPSTAVVADLGIFPALRLDPGQIDTNADGAGTAYIVNVANSGRALDELIIEMAGVDPIATFQNPYTEVISTSQRWLPLLRAVMLGSVIAAVSLLLALLCATSRMSAERGRDARALRSLGGPLRIRVVAHVVGLGIPMTASTLAAAVSVTTVWAGIAHIDAQTRLSSLSFVVLWATPPTLLLIVLALTYPAVLAKSGIYRRSSLDVAR